MRTMKLHLFNTFGRRKEQFQPVKSFIRMYVCGPTVYDHAHIGHARSYIFFDVVKRFLEYTGFDVLMVRNYTDVDDKIIKRAKELKKNEREIAERYIASFEEDMKKLKVKDPEVKPRVTDHIGEIIETVAKLVEKGFAYITPDGVYFHVPSFKDYGKLSGKNIEQLKSGARVEPSRYKKHPLDFALWKNTQEGIQWDSPWGKGRPGWHIECSVMSSLYLGMPFDIHGGGEDLIFPHHENEIAQAEAAHGKKFVNYWLHNGFVKLRGEKMSKSLGNVWLIKEALKEHRPEEIRYLMLSSHYRSPIEIDEEKLKISSSSVERIASTFQDITNAGVNPQAPLETQEKILSLKNRFIEALSEDFNTPKAIAVVHEFVNSVAEMIKEKKVPPQALDFMEAVENILGIVPETGKNEKMDNLMEVILSIREKLRKEKRYDLADAIREELSSIGIEVKDTPSGPIWNIKK